MLIVSQSVSFCVQANSRYCQRFISATFTQSDDVLPSLGCRENISRATAVCKELLLSDVIAACSQVQSSALSSE